MRKESRNRGDMARPTNESGLVRNIVKAIKREYPDAFVWKVHGGPYQVVGIPDLAACVNGLYVGIEIKHQKPGESEAHARERTTLIQRQRIKEIIQAGGIAGTALSEEEALEIISRGLERLRERTQK